MKSNRLKIVALCLGVALLVMTGSAMAGTTAFNTGTSLKFAREVGQANQLYTLPAGFTVTRTVGVPLSESFMVVVTLDGGAKINSGPANGNLTVTTTTGTVGTINIFSGGTNSATVTYYVTITAPITSQATLNLAVAGWVIKDVSNVLGGGGTINISVTTQTTLGSAFDSGTDSVGLIAGSYGVAINPALSAGAAVIDVGSNRFNFTSVTGKSTTTTDIGASLGIRKTTTASPFVYTTDGSVYTLTNLSSIQLLITATAGDLTGIKSVNWASTTASVPTAGWTSPITLTVGGGSTSFDEIAKTITITVDGSTTLVTRTLAVQVNWLSGGGLEGTTGGSRTLLAATTMTTWTLNGTVLIAPWTTGNNALYNGRIYIFNPSSLVGSVVAQVYTLPVGMGGSTLLGTISLGTLPASSGTNIRVAEDLLANISGVTLPYTTNGGNLVIKFTINATNVVGYSQVFGSTLAFGTSPLLVSQ